MPGTVDDRQLNTEGLTVWVNAKKSMADDRRGLTEIKFGTPWGTTNGSSIVIFFKEGQ